MINSFGCPIDSRTRDNDAFQFRLTDSISAVQRQEKSNSALTVVRGRENCAVSGARPPFQKINRFAPDQSVIGQIAGGALNFIGHELCADSIFEQREGLSSSLKEKSQTERRRSEFRFSTRQRTCRIDLCPRKGFSCTDAKDHSPEPSMFHQCHRHRKGRLA
jgi:hypothetical protein